LSIVPNGKPSQSYGASPATWEIGITHRYLTPDTGECAPATEGMEG